MLSKSISKKIRVEIYLATSVCLLLIQGSLQSRAQANTPLAALKSQSPVMTLRRVWVYSPLRIDVTGSVSIDGRYIAFEDKTTGDLAVHDLISRQNRRLTRNNEPGEESLWSAEISRDSKQVAYSWRNQDGSIDLRIIGLDGSGERVLYRNDEVNIIQPEGWLPDGQNILVLISRKDQTNQIALISTAEGSLRVLKNLGSWRDREAHLFLSPDGQYIAYDFHPSNDSSEEDISVLTVDGTHEISIVKHSADDNVLGWSSDGKWILFRGDRAGNDDMWAIQIAADGKPDGKPKLIRKTIGNSGRGFTQGGAFFYETWGNFLTDIYAASLDSGTGKVSAAPKPLTEGMGLRAMSPDFSPDGKYLAYYVAPESETSLRRMRYGPGNIVVRSLRTDQEREISLSDRIYHQYYGTVYLRWFPDGTSILLCGFNDKELFGLYKADVQTGNVIPIVQFAQQSSKGIHDVVWTGGCSRDSKTLFYARGHFNSAIHRWQRTQILARDLETGHERELYHVNNETFGDLDISPDGRHLTFASPWRKARTLIIIPTAGGEPHELLSMQRPDYIDASTVAWTPDGRYILFGKGNDNVPEITELWRISTSGGKAQRLGLDMDGPGTLRIHPDGKQIAFTGRQQMRELWIMENFLPEPSASK